MTCTVPGHEECTITCSNGCGAAWSETQKCRTWCNNNLDAVAFSFEEDEIFSIHISELPTDGLVRMLGTTLSSEFATNILTVSKVVSITLTDVTKKDLIKALQEQLR